MNILYMTEIIARAPLRVSFAGGGTDLPAFSGEHGGCVVSAAIGRHASAELRAWREGMEGRPAGRFLMAAVAQLDPAEATAGWSGTSRCDVPAGSGLGSSSSTMVALVGLVAHRLRREMSPSRIADAAYRAERHGLAMPCGLQDQYASAHGGLNVIRFDGESAEVTPLRMPVDGYERLERSLLLCFLHRTRDSQPILADQVSRIRDQEAHTIAALKEQLELADEVRRVITAGRIEDLGELLSASWRAKRASSPLVSLPVAEEALALAGAHGALGGKVTGAGGGGNLLLLCEPGRRDHVAEAMEYAGLAAEGVTFDHQGLRLEPAR